MPQPAESRWLTITRSGAQVVVVLAVLVASVVGWDEVPGLLPGCVHLEVSTSIEEGKIDVLQDLAEEYNDKGRRLGGRCGQVSVHGTTSGLAMQGLRDGWEETLTDAADPGDRIPDEPQVWTPTSSMWLELLRHSGEVPGLPNEDEWESVTRSVLAVAMPQTMAEELGTEELTWERLGELVGTRWQDHGGDPDWGEFSFGKDNPTLSTSGLAATVATYYAATEAAGISRDELGNHLADDRVHDFVLQVEAGVHHYDDDIVDVLRNLARYDAEGNPHDYVSAIILQEQLVYEYNTGAYSPPGVSEPREKLVTFYPTESTLELDHPFVVLPSASGEQRRLAADFLDHLQERESQDDLAQVGYRYGADEAHPWTLAGDVASEIRGRSAIDQTERVEPPDGRLVDQMLTAWEDVRKPANILLVLDTSSSMRQPGAGDASRLETMQSAVQAGIDQFLTEDHNVGLWSFPSDDYGVDPQDPYEPLVDVAPLSELHRRDIRDAISGLDISEGGATPIYRTVAAAYEELANLRRVQEQRAQGEGQDAREHINAIVVLTDGQNNDPADPTGYTADELFVDIGNQPGEPIKVFTIGFDEQADSEFVDRLAQETSGRSYDASDPAKLEEIFLDVVQNF